MNRLYFFEVDLSSTDDSVSSSLNHWHCIMYFTTTNGKYKVKPLFESEWNIKIITDNIGKVLLANNFFVKDIQHFIIEPDFTLTLLTKDDINTLRAMIN